MIHASGFRWELSGGAAQAAKITKVLNTDAYPGVNNSEIDIVVDKPYFNVSDIIIPENQEYRWRVITQDGSRQHRRIGPNQYQYTLKLTTNNPQFYMPRYLLELNKEWRKVSSAVADEANIDGGGFQFYSIFQSEGFVQQHSMKLEVTDKTARKAKAWADANNFNDNDLGRYANSIRQMWTEAGKLEGKPIAGFMSVLDSEMFNTLYASVENTLASGQESNIMYSPEGYQIYTASGMREQLKSTWSLEHNGNMTLQELEDWFDSILKDKVNDGDCKVVLSAGREFRIYQR